MEVRTSTPISVPKNFGQPPLAPDISSRFNFNLHLYNRNDNNNQNKLKEKFNNDPWYRQLDSPCYIDFQNEIPEPKDSFFDGRPSFCFTSTQKKQKNEQVNLSASKNDVIDSLTIRFISNIHDGSEAESTLKASECTINELQTLKISKQSFGSDLQRRNSRQSFTVVKPFSFESREKEKQEHKEAKLNYLNILQEKRKSELFQAKILPKKINHISKVILTKGKPQITGIINNNYIKPKPGPVKNQNHKPVATKENPKPFIKITSTEPIISGTKQIKNNKIQRIQKISDAKQIKNNKIQLIQKISDAKQIKNNKIQRAQTISDIKQTQNKKIQLAQKISNTKQLQNKKIQRTQKISDAKQIKNNKIQRAQKIGDAKQIKNNKIQRAQTISDIKQTQNKKIQRTQKISDAKQIINNKIQLTQKISDAKQIKNNKIQRAQTISDIKQTQNKKIQRAQKISDIKQTQNNKIQLTQKISDAKQIKNNKIQLTQKRKNEETPKKKQFDQPWKQKPFQISAPSRKITIPKSPNLRTAQRAQQRQLFGDKIKKKEKQLEEN